jgi:hypothetical protein
VKSSDNTAHRPGDGVTGTNPPNALVGYPTTAPVLIASAASSARVGASAGRISG